jgi:predicted DNA-binding transcriptional regulator YafY
MGQRSATRSVAAVMVAFTERKTWTQADLARAVGLSTEAVRKVLSDLVESGAPLVSEKDHPHVYWRMARDWYPGGVVFREEHVSDLLRELTHLPRSKVRDRLLATIMNQLPCRGKLVATVPVVSRAVHESEEQWLPVIETGAARKVPVFIKYVTASRGARASDRYVSVHVVDIGPPARFIATCHSNKDLRWFRVDGIVRARIDDREKFLDCPAATVDAFRASSLDGYKGTGAPLSCSFFVREPDSAWVANNLMDGMRIEQLPGGIQVTVETSALLRLARFVVSLGNAAQPETPALAHAVAALARGALEQAEEALEERQTPASHRQRAIPVQPRSDV